MRQPTLKTATGGSSDILIPWPAGLIKEMLNCQHISIEILKSNRDFAIMVKRLTLKY